LVTYESLVVPLSVFSLIGVVPIFMFFEEGDTQGPVIAYVP
jgi:hypothetical protein